ncbi:urea ABC transporter permease subunit UrtC [Hydrocarboniclastica marina]|uniref:Urea ABC transporter permease subunit UrtC n=2 Tax=Hydrocarboniclastica marina TaxID=2259620 RepID=A0A4P7XHY8_9ALTE|nr:urea ABC transporter permease subunit UrtC [Hydrocarboniclastica marina]
MGGCTDIWFGLGHCRYRRGGVESADQCRAQSWPAVHHRLLSGCRFWRRRQPLGCPGGRHDTGHCQQGHRALCRCGTGKSAGSDRHYLVYPETPARTLCAQGPVGGELAMTTLSKGPLSRFLSEDPAGRRLLAVIALITVLVPLLHLTMPADSIFHVPGYTMTVWGKYLCYALLALSVDLVWGFCGILSLGHGAFFALGGYGMGMYLMRQIGTRGVYGDPVLPDFMVFLNWQELPWYWYGMDNFGFAMLMVLLVPGLLAYVFGWLAFRSRVTGVYLSIITQAMTYALMLAFFRNEMGFGGNNGLTDFKDILGFDLQSPETRAGLFAATGLALMAGYLLCRRVVGSRLGRAMVATRDAESRTRFLGYRVEHVKVFAFTLSALLAAVAGALFVPQVGIINPSEFSPVNSIEIIVWVAVGGRGTLYGPVIGAILVNFAKTWFTGAFPEFWLFFLGGLFVVTTLYLPKGVVGVWQQQRDRVLARRARAGSEPSSPSPQSPGG